MSKKIAVVLMQLGGPDSPEAVEPFLFNLFMDPDIIDFPFARIARRPLARFLSSRRSEKVADHYKEIGGKSPLLGLTFAQAGALQKRLDQAINSNVFVAMRYWHPLTESVVQKVRTNHFDEIILLPLYPQYSVATSGSSINEWNRQCAKIGFGSVPQKTIHHFYDHPKFIDAIVDNVNRTLLEFVGAGSKDISIVFSAHGVPVSMIEKGDPYRDHVEATVRLVVAQGQWESPYVLCYQSKVGPMQWLKPSLLETIDSLGKAGRKNLLVVPVAFVSEHVETLHEINIEARSEAEKSGIERFRVMPALNDHPLFIEALADLVLQETQGD